MPLTPVRVDSLPRYLIERFACLPLVEGPVLATTKQHERRGAHVEHVGDFIESGAEAGAPKYMEWYGAFGLMVTLVWLYLEILRLLSKLREN